MGTFLKTTRRDFLKTGAADLASLNLSGRSPATAAAQLALTRQGPVQWKARWIWYPERRTLPSTFVFFRKEFELTDSVQDPVAGWVSGHSRYMLWVNGAFVQRGPAPCDPRYWEVDPVNLEPHLRQGKNVVAGLVCSFGGGDGTYVPNTPIGLPAAAGFLFQAEIPARHSRLMLVTDETWQVHRGRCWPPGNYQRWYLRALQENFDARHYPHDWNSPGFDASTWRPAEVLRFPPGRPVLHEVPRENWQEDWRLVPRSIPLLEERPIIPRDVTNAGWITWTVPPEEYFECFTPGAFQEAADSKVMVAQQANKLFPLTLAAPGDKSVAVTFDFGEEVCGHPFVRLRAPTGSTAEILYVETQDPGKLLLRTAPEYGQWLRVTAREGETYYEAFDWDALRFLQLAIRGSREPVEVLEVGVIERRYRYPHHPDIKTSDAALQRAVAGAVCTHLITSQDTLMDNITRERQQYAGDVDHAKLTSYYGFGEYRQAARMIHTYAQGQNDEGWFMDCWPAWDRCQRLWQKSLHLTQWGPIIDHGLGFVISSALYYLFSGNKETIEQVYPRFVKFERWLADNLGRDGLLPATGWIRNSVWMDHRGWKDPVDKKAALNIYYLGFLREGMTRLANWLGDRREADLCRQRAAAVAARVRASYWSETHNLFVDNLPRHQADGELRLHDRTLAMALLYGLFPRGREKTALDILGSLPTNRSLPIFQIEHPNAEVGFSFPANAGWRLWALSLFGRGHEVVRDLRERWGQMPSLLQNNVFSENWEPRPSESGDVWCQNGPVVLYVLYRNVLGIQPTAPGFAEFDVRPQLGDLAWIEGTVHSPQGAIRVRHVREDHHLKVFLTVSGNLRAALVFPENVQLEGLPAEASMGAGPVAGTNRWRLPVSSGQKEWKFDARVL